MSTSVYHGSNVLFLGVLLNSVVSASEMKHPKWLTDNFFPKDVAAKFAVTTVDGEINHIEINHIVRGIAQSSSTQVIPFVTNDLRCSNVGTLFLH